jgi:outer membrane protein
LQVKVPQIARRKGLTATGWLSLLLASSALGQAAAPAAGETESLNDALVAALAASPQFAGQTERVREIVASRLKVARSHWLPAIKFASSAGVKSETDTYDNTFMPVDSGTVRPVDLSVTLEQPIYRGGQTLAEIRGARAAVSAEEARQAGIEEQVLEHAAKSYLEVVTHEQIVRLRGEDVTNLRQIEDSVRLQVESGQLTRTDVSQAESRLAASTIELSSALSKLETARAQYEEAIGHAPGKLERPASILELPPSLTAALSSAMVENPDVRAADFDQQDAEQKVRATRGQLLPSIDLSVYYQRNRNNYLIPPLTISPFKVENTAALLKFTVPLYTPGQYSQLSAARHAQRQAVAKAEQAELKVTTSVRTAWASREAALTKVEGYTRIARVSREVLEGVHTEQLAGTRTVLDVLNAQRDVVSADLSLIAARNEADVAEIDLAVAIGAMTLEGLGLPGAE